MRNKVYIILLLSSVFALTSCAGYYTSMGATSAKCSKIGIVQKRVWFDFLGLSFRKDISIATAAKNGGITKIAAVDKIVKPGFLSVLYITKVCGE